MARHLILFLFAFLFSHTASAEEYIPKRQEVVTPDMDFYGSDLTAMFDTTVEACRKLCVGNPDCRAYTYNTKSNACFPKSEIRERNAFTGAISAEIFDTDPAQQELARQRAGELDFLSPADFKRAYRQASDIGQRHPAGPWQVGEMRAAAERERDQGDALNAMRWTGGAISKTGSGDLWTQYAALYFEMSKQSEKYESRYQAAALSASINGYLRASSGPARADALNIMADMLEARGRGRDMIPPLRMVIELSGSTEYTQPRLDDAIAKYGFRIVEHRVDNENETPRICVEFNEALVQAGTDYTPFVRTNDDAMAVEASGAQICIDGVQHGERYQVTFREGLPAASGETLNKDVEIALYVRDRSPSVRFPGRAYVLPRAADAALPIETVNLDEVELKLRRVTDRNLLRVMQEGAFHSDLSSYQDRQIGSEMGENIWEGIGEVQNELNRTMTTRLPLGDVLAQQPPGIYALRAEGKGVDHDAVEGSTQWFVLTDLGLTTMQGTDGLHVFVRGLADAQVQDGVEITLLSRSNRELGMAKTDAQGHVLFAPGLTRGTGGAAPAMVIARAGQADQAFLSLTDPAFDLSDRGVEGRPAAPPVDVFLTTDRGAYRAGETINATVLARDAQAQATEGLPLTAILSRPDGVEYRRIVSAEDRAGGHVFSFPVGATVPRGSWSLEIKADVEAPALATRTVLVEDFVPERIDFTAEFPEGDIRPGETVPLSVEARYLFGAPGAGLEAEGIVRLSPKRRLDAFKGYRFGRHDEAAATRTNSIDQGETDSEGRLSLPVELPKVEVADRPYEATATLRMREGSGRAVERQVRKMLAPSGPMIGIKTEFDGDVPEGSEAGFQIIGIGADMQPQEMQVQWVLNRVETRYQWYQQHGYWEWEPVTRRERVETGKATLGSDPLPVSAPVKWGQYELVVERLDGEYVASSVGFYAGWYAPADASKTPDTLELSLDKPGYRSGETAELRLVPRYAGQALITVMSNHVVEMKAVAVKEGENVIPLEVTDDWGAGVYVTAQVVRPMNVAAGQNPARSLGLSYARIDPGDKQLDVTVQTAGQSAPRGPLQVDVQVDGLNGEAGYVTLAAVDVGILNLTGFQSPDPSAHYFGQRKLGVEIRDLYGRLIDGLNGAAGQVRSGGDAAQGGFDSPPPTEELVAEFSGPIEVDANGHASADFDIPDFNGTVRVMAVAWSGKAVGQDEADVLVRDPVVVTASLPRFMAPGDTSEMLLEIIHAEGPSGEMGLKITPEGDVSLGDVPASVSLGEQEKAELRIPVTAGEVGDHGLQVVLTTPDGKELSKTLTLPVRRNDPKISVTRRFALGAGEEFVLDEQVFADFRPGTASAVLSGGPLARLNAPGLLQALDAYPYGCTEQLASRAMPLLYLSEVSEAMGLADAPEVKKQIEENIARILTRQSSNGSFGLWSAASGDFWLNAYVGDFLSRARAEGYSVPDHAFTMAMDSLRNRINYAPDFDEGGEDIAYALMVLAREGAARMGDLRYYADQKAHAFATPLALAQLATALASYGDQTRADRLFRLSEQKMQQARDSKGRLLWRADYGTHYRDRAGLLSLAVESGSQAVDREGLIDSLSQPGPHMSTQEQAWTLMATKALLNDKGAGLSLNGGSVSGGFIRRVTEGMQPQVITNDSEAETQLTLTTLGVPETPPPAGGYGFQISRRYYDMQGKEVDPNGIASGTRLVTVLEISPAEKSEARLMINDPLPAGLEIDNPNLMRSGDINGLDWLNVASTEYTEFRSDRFLAAVNLRGDETFQLAYIVRATRPGTYHHPAPLVEDMYRPAYRANGATGTVEITP